MVPRRGEPWRKFWPGSRRPHPLHRCRKFPRQRRKSPRRFRRKNPFRLRCHRLRPSTSLNRARLPRLLRYARIPSREIPSVYPFRKSRKRWRNRPRKTSERRSQRQTRRRHLRFPNRRKKPGRPCSQPSTSSPRKRILPPRKPQVVHPWTRLKRHVHLQFPSPSRRLPNQLGLCPCRWAN